MKRNISIAAGCLVLLIIGIAVFSARPKKSPETTAVKKLIAQAQSAVQKGELLGARALYREALRQTEDLKDFEHVRSTLSGLNMELLFSPFVDECSVEYTVQPKDTLGGIAKKHNTTVALIKKMNNLEGSIIHPKQKLKVNTCSFSLAIDKSQNLLFLKRGGELMKMYLVSTGKDNCTPVGEFRIINKLENPTWFKTGAVIAPDSPENALGSRWMALNTEGIGIHGNRNVNEIGKQVTEGCVRMKNEDVEELYDIVPVGTEVIIVD